MIDRETWLLLAERCRFLRWWHTDLFEDPVLVFDDDDQARVVESAEVDA